MSAINRAQQSAVRFLIFKSGCETLLPTRGGLPNHAVLGTDEVGWARNERLPPEAGMGEARRLKVSQSITETKDTCLRR
ncbi:MAG: hypothetical protein V2G42_04760 [bacterium JZ-2024 1]